MSLRMQPIVALVMLAPLFLQFAGHAQEASAGKEPPPTTEIRTYDLSEFVQTIADYPLPPEPANENPAANVQVGPLFTTTGASTGGGGAARPQEKLDSLVKLVMDTVDPSSWKDTGGSIGAIRILGRQMVVSQTPANQRLIQELLNSLLSDSVMIEVDARWVMLTPEQLSAWHTVPEKGDALLRDLTNDHEAFYCEGRLVGFNGQTVSLISGQTTTVVTGVTPVVGTGVAAYDVGTARERSGVSLQITPRLASRQNGIVVDVHSKVTQDLAGTGKPLGLSTAPATQPVDAKATDSFQPNMPPAPIGQPDRLETAFNTTVRLTPDSPLVIGGMTREPGKQGSRQLCLILIARTLDAPAAKSGTGK